MTINGDVKTGDLFVFYGLLQPVSESYPHVIDLAGSGAFLGEARIRGDLYDVGGYPGMVAGDGLVCGTLYRIDDPVIVPEIDAFEDIVPGEEAESLYRREQHSVLKADGVQTGQTAWVYIFNKPLAEDPKIESGDWLKDGEPHYRKRKRTLLQWARRGVFATLFALFAYVLLSLVIGIIFDNPLLTLVVAVSGALGFFLIALFGNARNDVDHSGPDASDMINVRMD
ncbi:gamma-glutamylcyclotransferase family protein [Ponticaulis koreensis]|uniref:gamma-glutamylcyclotransferase family protein n=1 Tax=Ponticaulis koreensis TaxID=1123045 RepID=UPI0003B5859C|nr:gamma-glutamylcyclotransferase family protein [Ponticaulis koreensis]